MAIHDEKYIVMKRSDFDTLFANIRGSMEPLLVEDAVVLRKQDIFTPAALEAYASAVHITLESEVNGLTAEVRRELENILGYFQAQAFSSWNSLRRLPS